MLARKGTPTVAGGGGGDGWHTLAGLPLVYSSSLAILLAASFLILTLLLCKRHRRCSEIQQPHVPIATITPKVRISYSRRSSGRTQTTLPTQKEQVTSTKLHEPQPTLEAKVSPLPIPTRTMPPSTPHDDRPSVVDLLATHAASLSALREHVSVDALYSPEKHDDLWLLRFLLSHLKPGKEASGVRSAAKAARSTLAWRAANSMDQISVQLQTMLSADEHPNIADCHANHMLPDCCLFVQPDASRGPLILCDLAGLDVAKCMQHVTRDEYAMLLATMNEWCFVKCDRVSRATGRLTKTCRVLTLKRADARKLIHQEYLKRDGACAKEIEDCYPQLLGSVIILDPPRWILAVWRGLKYLFPPRFVEKLDLISSSSQKEVERRVLRFAALEDLPTDLGGRKPGPFGLGS